MPLTDEQRSELRQRFNVGSDTLDALWNEAYRLGMLRAADIVFNIDDKQKRLHAMPEVDAILRIGYGIGLDDAEDAIRAEATSAKPPRS